QSQGSRVEGKGRFLRLNLEGTSFARRHMVDPGPSSGLVSVRGGAEGRQSLSSSLLERRRCFKRQEFAERRMRSRPLGEQRIPHEEKGGMSWAPRRCELQPGFSTSNWKARRSS